MFKLLNIWFMAKTKPESNFPYDLNTLSIFFFLNKVLKGSIIFPQQTWKNSLKHMYLSHFGTWTQWRKVSRYLAILLIQERRPPGVTTASSLLCALPWCDLTIRWQEPPHSKPKLERRLGQCLSKYCMYVCANILSPLFFCVLFQGHLTLPLWDESLQTNAPFKHKLVGPSPFPFLPNVLLLSQRDK